MEHYKTLSSIFPMLFRCAGEQKQVLLLQRANTGYMDGMWDFAGSGHVDEGETAMEAVARECREELGIFVETGGMEFAHLTHRIGLNGARTYYDIYFAVHRFEGVPYIAEPEKCSGLDWFSLDKLPEDMIPMRRAALDGYLSGARYSEFRL